MSRFVAGQRVREFPTGTWNRLVDLVNSPPPDLKGRPPENIQTRGGQLLVEVVPDVDLVEHGVAVISAPVFTPASYGSTGGVGEQATLEPPAVDVVAPSGPSGTAVVTLEPIKADTAGLAVIRGLTWGRITIMTGTETHAVTASGNTQVLDTSSTGQFKIVWREGGTGTQWALLLFEQPGGGGSTDPMTRNFKLTVRKLSTQANATWVWLENDLVTECGTAATFTNADPHLEFYGLVTPNPAKGRATLVYDHCNATSRWEITHLESPADFICGTTATVFDSGTPQQITPVSYWGPDWHKENPGDVEIDSCNWPDLLPGGNEFKAVLRDPNATPLLYEIIEFKQTLGCGLEYDGTANNELKVKPSDLAGDGLVVAGIGCALDVNVGCGLEIVTDTVKVKPSDLAGTGLTPGTGCSLDVQIDGTYLYYDGGSNYLTVLNTTTTVITGCASPNFVTFDASGNPTFNFTTATIRILEVVSTGTTSCSADGTLSCT